jgi:hypothetical protein
VRNMEERIEQNMRRRAVPGVSEPVNLLVNVRTSPLNDPGPIFEIKWHLQGAVKGFWGVRW